MTDGNHNRMEQTFWAEPVKEKVTLRRTPEGSPICPVCGDVWDPRDEHAWYETKGVTEEGLRIVQPSYLICPSCNTEFGNDDLYAVDESLEANWASLRDKWLQKTGRSAAALAQVRDHLGLEL